MTRLFSPITIGQAALRHRVVMAPLTRFRCDADNVLLPFAVDYYAQRASIPGTLLIAEATQISPAAGGLPNASAIWNDGQIAAWKKVTDAVHARGSYIFCQLIALGRTAVPAALAAASGGGDGDSGAGYEVCAPSAIPLGPDAVVPKELTETQIQSTIADFATAAKNAIAAGFDGVEAHGANGYLIDQFLQDVSNQRSDRWGGSVENRARFTVEVAKALVGAVGADRVAFRFSPWNTWQGMRMADPREQFAYVTRQLREIGGLAYLHLIESRVNNWADVDKTEGIEFMLEAWGPEAPVILAGGFNAENSSQAVDEEYRDYNVAVAYGRHFLANPDLPFRLQRKLALNKYDRETFYAVMQPQGYADYPFSAEYLAQTAQA